MTIDICTKNVSLLSAELSKTYLASYYACMGESLRGHPFLNGVVMFSEADVTEVHCFSPSGVVSEL